MTEETSRMPDDLINKSQTTLNGLTILRFTHATERTGGVEQYLDDINAALLQRNKMTIIQLYLPLTTADKKSSEDQIGSGTLIKISMAAEKIMTGNSHPFSIKSILKKIGISNIIRDTFVYNPVLHKYLKKYFVIPSYSRYEREPVNVKETFADICRKKIPDLIVIHQAGGLGSSKIIEEAKAMGIPYLILNHFSNDRFKIVGFREQMRGASGVGGVSKQDVPEYLKNAYRNLSDGIDTEFFKINTAQQNTAVPIIPQITLPARIVSGKGHHDLLKVANILRKKGLEFRLVFAGRKNDADYFRELENLTQKLQLSDSVVFTGELSRQDMKECFTQTSIVVLPSYNEGLGRVLLEAQAMSLPVIAYNVGGVSAALQDRITGFLVKKGDIDNLALRIYELLTDNVKRNTMGSAGRKFVENNFSFPIFAKRHEDWYLQALNKKNINE